MKKTSLLLCAFFLGVTVGFAQQKIGGSVGAPNASAYLQLGDSSGGNKGFLIARVALTATNSQSPLTAATPGMIVYNTATAGSGATAVTPGVYVWNGSQWDRAATASATSNLYTSDGTLSGNRTVSQGTNSLTFSSAATTTTAQSLAANSLTTGTAKSITANALTTGSILSVSSSNNNLNSANGLLQVANTGTSTNGVLVRMQSNSTSGSGLTVLTNGNVGIGSVSPQQALEVNGNLLVKPNSLAINPGLLLRPTTGNSTTGYSPLILQNIAGNNVFKIQQEVGTTEGGIWFFTDENNNGATEAHRISILRANGYVGFGVLTPTAPLQMSSGAFVSTAGVWTNASDARLKSDIHNSNYGLAEVMKLRPVAYTMNIDKSKQVGFIAQEVRRIVPEVVMGKEGDISKGETLGLAYGNLVPVLTKAIQEQQKQIETLTNKVRELEEKIETLLKKQ